MSRTTKSVRSKVVIPPSAEGITLSSIMETQGDVLIKDLNTQQLNYLEKLIVKQKKKKQIIEKSFKQNYLTSPHISQATGSILSNINQHANFDNGYLFGNGTTTYSLATLDLDPTLSVKLDPKPVHALPATQPKIKVENGVEYLNFSYSAKGSNNTYCIRIDIERIDVDRIDRQFKKENCLYPRANVPKENYAGNRWAYETECNHLGWKLSFLNAEVLSSRRGLLQRAVDSYRNRSSQHKSRRVSRMEKVALGTLRKKVFDLSPPPTSELNPKPNKAKTIKKNDSDKSMDVGVYLDGVVYKLNLDIDFGKVNLATIDQDFKDENAVYPRANCSITSYEGSNYELENYANELGWKLAHLNQEYLCGRKPVLQRVIDAYRNLYEIHPTRKYTAPVSSANETHSNNSDAFNNDDLHYGFNFDEGMEVDLLDHPNMNTEGSGFGIKLTDNQINEIFGTYSGDDFLASHFFKDPNEVTHFISQLAKDP